MSCELPAFFLIFAKCICAQVGLGLLENWWSVVGIPASILRKSTSGRYRPVSYPDGPMTARYRFT